MTLSVSQATGQGDGRTGVEGDGQGRPIVSLHPCIQPLVCNVVLNIFYQCSGKLRSDRMGLKYLRLFCKKTDSK